MAKRRKPATTTTARPATGREREIAQREQLPLPLAAALDAIARVRATGEPLERALADVAGARRLGPRERRAAGDAAFAWARRRETAERLVDEALASTGGVKPARRERDLAALLLALASAGAVDDAAVVRLPEGLRALVEDTIAGGIGVAASVPPWLRERLARAHPADVDALVRALSEPAPLVLAVDGRRGSAGVDDVVARVGGRRSAVVDGAVIAGTGRKERQAWRALSEHVWPMDDGSQAVARAVDAQPGELVLDLCAGGGGKARWLASTGARVVASDAHPARLAAAPATVARVVVDGRWPPFRAGTFDKVLVDAPCSGTGTLRRAPDLAQRLEPGDVDAFSALQRELLAAALGVVKPGGLVVYATCSLLREENEDVVDAVVPLAPGSAGAEPCAIPWRGVRVDGAAGRARLLPHVHGTDGFFVAALRRRRP